MSWIYISVAKFQSCLILYVWIRSNSIRQQILLSINYSRQGDTWSILQYTEEGNTYSNLKDLDQIRNMYIKVLWKTEVWNISVNNKCLKELREPLFQVNLERLHGGGGIQFAFERIPWWTYCCLTTTHLTFFAYFSETLSYAGHIS